MKSQPSIPSIFELAKSSADIPEMWERLNLPGEPNKCCHSPLRIDHKPSFSVFDEGRKFKDFGTDEWGDVIDFVAIAMETTKLEAARFILSGNEIKAPACMTALRSSKSILPSKPKPKPKSIPLEKGSDEELDFLANQRNLPMISGLNLLQDRGILAFGELYGERVWCVRDNANLNLQYRPLDPLKACWERKAHTAANSQTTWPIGLDDAKHRDNILLCEGPPDMLAVATAAVIEQAEGLLERVGFACMTGASQQISPEALPLFRKKSCRIFIHNESAGRKASKKWSSQLIANVRQLSTWASDTEGEDFNDYAARFWTTSTYFPEPLTILKNAYK